MGKVEVKPLEKIVLRRAVLLPSEDLDKLTTFAEEALSALDRLREEVGDFEQYETDPNTPTEDRQYIYHVRQAEKVLYKLKPGAKDYYLTPEDIRSLSTFVDYIAEAVEEAKTETEPDTPPVEGTGTAPRKVRVKLSAQDPGGAVQELKKLSKAPPLAKVKISRDLMDTQIHSRGETLDIVTDPTKRDKIRELQKQGKLLSGTLEGLSGGGAYLKVFTIALAETLNEQSKYYKTPDDYTGVPVPLINDMFRGSVSVTDNQTTHKGETRRSPYVLVSYSALAKKMKGEGKRPSGKDISYIRDYIKDLSGKEYLLDGGGGTILGVPLIIKEGTIYREDTGSEVGCLLRLSHQFSKTMNGYKQLKGGTIQKIGGGKQKEITLNLLDLLITHQGLPTFRKNKEDLFAEIATSQRYQTRKGERDRDFAEAVKKAKEAGLIISYTEEAPKGERVSVFTYNPDYPGDYRGGVAEVL